MKLRAAILFFVALALTGCLSEEKPVVKEHSHNSEDALYENGSANLLLDETLAAQLELGGPLPEEFSSRGIVAAERLFPDAGEFEERHRAFGLHLWYRVEYGSDMTATRARDRFAGIRGVQVFEPVTRLKRNSFPFNDPYLPSQWHYYNDGSGNEWLAGADINVLPVWNNYTTGREDVIVAVVDQGVDAAHEDLAGQVLLDGSYNFAIPGAAVKGDKHGTHVGGTIAAINNNGKGVCGIAGGNAAAGNTGVKLLTLSIFDDRAQNQGSGATAIIWAADHGAVLVNNSWGPDYNLIENVSERIAKAKADHELMLQPNTGQYTHSMKTAIDYFNATAGITDGVQTGPMAGGLCFFAAGNDSWQYGAYAAYPECVAVGAFGPNGRRAYYSCYGPWVDIAAPGGDDNNKMILSTFPDNTYGWYQGTSMACPHAVGVAALVVSQFGGPGFTREMLLEKLIGGARADDAVFASQSIGPMIDALGAIMYGVNLAPAKVSDAAVSVKSNYVDVAFSVTGKGEVPAYGYMVLAGKDQTTVQNTLPNSIPSTVIAVAATVPENAGIGDPFTINLSGLDFNTDYYLKVIGYDYSRNYSEPSSVLALTTGSNHAPAIVTESETTSIELHSFETAILEFSIADEDGHEFDVVFTPGSEADAFQRNTLTGKYILTVTAKKAQPGSYTGSITATDSFGAVSSKQITYTILPNQAPSVIKDMENLLLSAPGQTVKIDMSKYVNDPDGETLSYTITNSAPSVIHFNPVGGVLNGSVLGYGSADISVVGKDAAGETVKLGFKVLIRKPDVVAGIYPNPVKDKLYIGTGAEEEDAHVSIVSSSGARVFDRTIKASAFSPAIIDFVKCAPGRYAVTVVTGGKTVTQTVVKK